ncbi:MAG: hypothetical protein VYE68_05520 [Acidobacteriota bacterium]|nr:hypothetical protein [Acidobacteriota bacterium]
MNRWLLSGVLLLLLTVTATGQDQYALIVSGASGGEPFRERHEQWRTHLVTVLRNQPGFDEKHLTVLGETPGPDVGRASREGVFQALDALAERVPQDAVVYVVLIGHGTFDGTDAKFNLVGPDLSATDWDTLLTRFRGQVVFVNTTAASSPFIDRLSQPGRVVVTATESPVQRFDTTFPQFFVEAFTEPAADRDKNGQVSVLEAFEFASDQVRRWYQRRGRLSTERALIDDNGDRRGREAGQPGPDGRLAARLYLGAGPPDDPEINDPVLAPLIAERRALLTALDELRATKDSLPETTYRAELERTLVALARLSRDIRRRTASVL